MSAEAARPVYIPVQEAKRSWYKSTFGKWAIRSLAGVALGAAGGTAVELHNNGQDQDAANKLGVCLQSRAHGTESNGGVTVSLGDLPGSVRRECRIPNGEPPVGDIAVATEVWINLSAVGQEQADHIAAANGFDPAAARNGALLGAGLATATTIGQAVNRRLAA